MKLTIEKSDLSPALLQTRKLVKASNTIPVLNNILLMAEGGQLSISATDLDRMLNVSIPADVVQSGAVTVPAHKLADIVSKLPDGCQIAIDSTDDGRITVKAGRSRFYLPVLPVDDFPNMAAGEFPVTFELDSLILEEAMASVGFAMSNEEVRYYLNGIFIHINADQMICVATDGHRLAKYEMTAPQGTEDMPGIILPRSCVEAIKSLFPKKQQAIQIYVSNALIRFVIDNYILTSKLIDAEYPVYQRVIPQDNNLIAAINRVNLIRAVERMSVLTPEKSRAVQFICQNNALTLETANTDNGQATETLDIDYSDQAYTGSYNASYLLDVLNHLDGEYVTIKLSDCEAPAILTGLSDSLLIVLTARKV